MHKNLESQNQEVLWYDKAPTKADKERKEEQKSPTTAIKDQLTKPNEEKKVIYFGEIALISIKAQNFSSLSDLTKFAKGSEQVSHRRNSDLSTLY